MDPKRVLKEFGFSQDFSFIAAEMVIAGFEAEGDERYAELCLLIKLKIFLVQISPSFAKGDTFHLSRPGADTICQTL